MKKAFLCSVVLLFVGTSVFSQTTSGAQMFDTRDYYLLLRIDELKRGERPVSSYKKLELP